MEHIIAQNPLKKIKSQYSIEMPGYGRERKRYKGSKRASKKKGYRKGRRVQPRMSVIGNVGRIRPVAVAKELYCKLKVAKIEEFSVSGASSTRRLYLGNSPSIFPPQGALGAFVGPANPIPASELLYGGFPEYGSFYDKHRMLASKIRLEAFVNTNSNDSFVRAVFIPIAPNPDSDNDAIDQMVNQLDAYNFEELMCYPNAQCKQAALQTGGFARFRFKAYRKTKNMLSIQNLRDEEALNVDMPGIDASGAERPGVTYLWGYYFRVFNATAAVSQIIRLNVQMVGYFNFNRRRYLQGLTVPA